MLEKMDGADTGLVERVATFEIDAEIGEIGIGKNRQEAAPGIAGRHRREGSEKFRCWLGRGVSALKVIARLERLLDQRHFRVTAGKGEAALDITISHGAPPRPKRPHHHRR